MTSLAFIFGVLPLTMAVGAGAEMRQSLGTAVFAGMVGVTVFGLLFTPTFYVFVRALPARVIATWHWGTKYLAPVCLLAALILRWI